MLVLTDICISIISLNKMSQSQFSLRNFLKISLFFSLFLISPLASSATDTSGGAITGVVKTADGEPASYVTVSLKGLNRGAISDEFGRYHIKNVKEGNYTLVASFVGLQSQERSVVVVNGKTTTVDFELQESAQQLAEIVVTGISSGNEKEVSIGKVAIKPMDLPQSTMQIDRQVLERQQSLQLSDVLMNTNGVYVMGNTGGTQEEIAGRGFSFSGSNGVSNTFKNGTRFNNSVMPELSSLEKVEVLKGSNAILFGNVAPGGVLNLVTKKPTFASGGEISYRTGSFGMVKPSVDIYGPMSNSNVVAYRLNTSYQRANSFRDEVSSERIYFNPSALIKATSKTEVLVEGDYLKDNRTQDFGIGATNYVINDLPRNKFIGAKWAYFKAEQKSAGVSVTHTLNDAWQVKASASYQGYVSDAYGTTRPNASGHLMQEDGTWVRGLQRSEIDQDYLLTQIDVTGKFSTGAIQHTVLVGGDLDKYTTRTTAYAYTNPAITGRNKNVYDTINIYNEQLHEQRTDIPSIDKTTLTKNPIERTGFYVQDLISVTSYLKVLAGVRYSYMESKSDILTYSSGVEVKTDFYDDAFTPRFGIVYQPTEQISLFSSYANSFTLNTGVDVNRQPLPPSFIDQYEVGAKSDLFNGMISTNITAYQIVNSNLAQAVIGDPNNAQELAGEVTSKGLEVDISTKPIKGLVAMAGYSYNDTRYTESTQYIVGSKLRYNPAHTANSSLHYTFSGSTLKGLTLGAVAFYMGDRMAGRSTQVTTPGDTRKLIPIDGYVQLDASIGYTVRAFSVRFKVSNVSNALSYNVHDDNSVNPIAPRQWAATFAYKL